MLHEIILAVNDDYLTYSPVGFTTQEKADIWIDEENKNILGNEKYYSITIEIDPEEHKRR